MDRAHASIDFGRVKSLAKERVSLRESERSAITNCYLFNLSIENALSYFWNFLCCSDVTVSFSKAREHARTLFLRTKLSRFSDVTLF